MLLSVLSAWAYSEQEARVIASKHLEKKGEVLRDNAVNVSDSKSYYAFDLEPRGFIIISAVNAFKNPVLFYCSNFSYHDKNLPYEVKEYLSKIQDMIDRAKSSVVLRSSSLTDDDSIFEDPRDSVAPLIKTNWFQKEPYNDLLHSSVTGCGATALAQVLYYYKYPDTCYGIPAYESYGVHYPSLEPTSFDYSQMKLSYDEGDTAPELAKLMKYCGYALKTDYGVESSATSGEVMVPALLIFNYSLSATKLLGNYYDYNDLEDIIYDEIKAGRPVLIAGYERKGELNKRGTGHWFICDGYYNYSFHFNMGWGDIECNEEYSADGLFEYPIDRHIIIGIKIPNSTKFKKGTLEISDLKLHSTYCVNDPSLIDFYVRNVGDEPYVGNIYMSSNLYTNSSGPVKIDGDFMMNDSVFIIEPNQYVKLSYSSSALSEGDVKLRFSTKEGELIDTINYHVGGYTNLNDSVLFKVKFLNFSYYDEIEDIYYVNPGMNDVEISFANYGSIPFRAVIQTFLTHNDQGLDTLLCSGDWVFEVPADNIYHRIEHQIYVPQIKYTYETYEIGIIPRFGSVKVSCLFNLEYRNANRISSMGDFVNSIPAEALIVYLNKFHPDTLVTDEANPNCLYLTDREDYMPVGVNSNLVINGHSDSIHIDANFDFYCDTDIIAKTVELDMPFIRSVSPSALRSGDDDYVWSTIMLPFAPDSAYLSDGSEIMHEGMVIYELDEHLNAVETNHIKPNVPYIVGVKLRGDDVIFKAHNATISASQDMNMKTDFGSLVSSSSAYSCMDPFDFFSVYDFDFETKSFMLDEVGMFDDRSPFTVSLMSGDFFGEESLPVNMTTGLDDIANDCDKSVILYSPLGVRIGEYQMINNQIGGLDSKGVGVYVSKSLKYINK